VYAVGEDRSSYQAVGSWGNNAFGFCKFTEDQNWTDPAARANWHNLKAEGKVRGGYHFFHPASPALAQARFFVDTVDRLGGFGPGDMFVADAEISAGADGMEAALPGAAARQHMPLLELPLDGQRAGEVKGGLEAFVGSAVLAFLNEVASLVGPACPVLLYSYLNMARTQLSSCVKYPLFVADYTASPPRDVSPWVSWTIWQRADHGAFGGGDADYFNGDNAQLLAWLATYPGNWTEALVNELPTLQLGSRDAAGGTWYVRRMQVLVAGVGRWSSLGKVTAISDDGVFGTSTEAAVKAVQRRYGLTEDGICGPKTWAALIA